MAFTYSGDPRTSPRDRLRFELVDTDGRAPKFSDEEIALALASSGDPEGEWRGAAATLAGQFARKLASQADVKVGALTLDFKRQSEEWKALAEEFALDSSGASDAPTETFDAPPTFGKGMHDNGGAGGGSPGYPPSGSRYTT